jgi:AbiV family abortive infection protein
MISPMTAPQRCAAPLTSAGAQAGIEAVRENAVRLARDARILLHARRYASAGLLAAMALVEFSRISALLALPLARGEQKTRLAWERFHEGVPNFPWSLCHRGKQALSDEQTNQMLALIGAIGERVDYIEPGAWTEPGKLVTRPLAVALVDIAETLCRSPVDTGPLMVWMEVVESSPEDAGEQEIFRRFRHELRSRGLQDIAQLPQVG